MNRMLGGMGLPFETRENKSVCNKYYMITTTGHNLLLVDKIDEHMFLVMDVRGEFEWVNMRLVDWPDQSHLPEEERLNRPSQTHYHRLILANLYGYACMQCGALGHLTVDHVVPRAENGWSSLDNLQLLCKDCNVNKAATYNDYRFFTPSEIFWMWANEYEARKK